MGTMNIVGGFVKEGLAVNLKIRFCDFLGSDTKLRTDGPTDMTYTYGVLFCFVTKAPLPPPPKKDCMLSVTAHLSMKTRHLT